MARRAEDTIPLAYTPGAPTSYCNKKKKKESFLLCVIFVLFVPEIFRNEGRLGARTGAGEGALGSLSALPEPALLVFLPEASPCRFPLTPLPKTQRGSASQCTLPGAPSW